MKRLKAVLLIDDDYISSWLNKHILEELQAVEQIECITDPISALVYLAKATSTQDNIEQHCPDIIFLDLDMPGIMGFDFLDRLQQIEGCQDLPMRTVLLTSSMDEADMSRAAGYNIHAYLVKPLTKTKAQEIIQSFLGESLPSAHE